MKTENIYPASGERQPRYATPWKVLEDIAAACTDEEQYRRCELAFLLGRLSRILKGGDDYVQQLYR